MRQLRVFFYCEGLIHNFCTGYGVRNKIGWRTHFYETLPTLQYIHICMAINQFQLCHNLIALQSGYITIGLIACIGLDSFNVSLNWSLSVSSTKVDS